MKHTPGVADKLADFQSWRFQPGVHVVVPQAPVLEVLIRPRTMDIIVNVIPSWHAWGTDVPHCGQAMRGGQPRVRREFHWWFGLSVDVLSLVPTKVFVVAPCFLRVVPVC